MDYQDQGDTPPETEKRAPLEARSPSSSTSLVGTDDKGGDREKAATVQAKPERRVLRDDQRLASLGSPRVLVEHWPWETRVRLDRPTWGFQDTAKTFLGAGTRSAERYAQQLFDRLCAVADANARCELLRKRGNGTIREIRKLLDRRERGIV